MRRERSHNVPQLSRPCCTQHTLCTRTPHQLPGQASQSRQPPTTKWLATQRGRARGWLEHRPPLGGWQQRPQGPSRGVTPEVGPHYLQQQVGVASQHILGLLAGQLVACQLSPPDWLLLRGRNHRCRCRGTELPSRPGQRPGGHVYTGQLGRTVQGEFLRGPGEAVCHHDVCSRHMAQV